MKTFADWPRNAQGFPQPPLFPQVVDTVAVWLDTRDNGILSLATQYHTFLTELYAKNCEIMSAALSAWAFFKRNPRTDIMLTPLTPMIKAVGTGAVNGYYAYPTPSQWDQKPEHIISILALEKRLTDNSISGNRVRENLAAGGYSTTEMPIQEGPMPDFGNPLDEVEV